MNINVKLLLDTATMPRYAHDGDSAMDLYAAEEALLHIGETRVIKTGIAMEIPYGYNGRVTGRSGLNKLGIFVPTGTIDSCFRGDISVMLHNTSQDTRIVNIGDRIGQLIIEKVEYVNLNEVEELSDSSRGTSGFGSTGR